MFNGFVDGLEQSGVPEQLNSCPLFGSRHGEFVVRALDEVR